MMKQALKGLLSLCLLLLCLTGGLQAQDNAANEQPILANLNDPGLQGAAEHGLIRDINTQVIQGVTVTLTHVFADANRIALWYTIQGIELPKGHAKGIFIQPVLLKADGSWFGTGAMSGGVTPLDPQNAPDDYFVIFDHEENYPSDGFYHLIFQLQIGGTIWVLPDDFVPTPGPLPDQYRVEIPSVGPFEFALSLPASNPVILQPNQTVEANGVSMTLQTLRIATSQTNISLCYDLPDERDWQPDIEVSIDGESGVTVAGNLTGKPHRVQNQSCFQLKSLLFYESASHHMTIRIDKLRTAPSEWTVDTTARAKDRLRQQGIEVEFYFTGNGAGYNVLHVPEGMDDPQISRAVTDALSEFYDGPWVFEVDLP
jgi:hypothetical protein